MECPNTSVLPCEEVVEIISETVTTGNDTKDLEARCIKVAETGTILNFFLELSREGLGTHPIENRARKFVIEQLSKNCATLKL